MGCEWEVGGEGRLKRERAQRTRKLHILHTTPKAGEQVVAGNSLLHPRVCTDGVNDVKRMIWHE